MVPIRLQTYSTLSLSGLILILAALVSAQPVPEEPGYGPDHHAPAHYEYGYKVHDDKYGADFGHHENRDGPVTKGEYHVLLPDGRVQTVTYYVDGYSGYVADVTYSGEAYHGPATPHHGPPPPPPPPAPEPFHGPHHAAYRQPHYGHHHKV
eukprot:maker-scaffold72_size415059-snap-gene-2.17 protein:Tk08676 transcript:maker-scaffold72_size415059-snap-gene-2.17-mRNA-1 annotation:"hypothetical protein DAPPUDRAFT_311515"